MFSSSYESDDDDETHYISQYSIVENDVIQPVEILPPKENIYGISTDFKLKEQDQEIYNRYCCNIEFAVRSQCGVSAPVVTDKSSQIYDNYINKISREIITNDTLLKYQKYVNNELGVFRDVVLIKGVLQ